MITKKLSQIERISNLTKVLHQYFTAPKFQLLEAHHELTLIVPAEQLLEVMGFLRDQPEFHFEQLIDLCGVDYAAYGQAEWETKAVSNSGFGRGIIQNRALTLTDSQRFAVVYHLLSITHNHRLRVRVYPVGDPPMLDSVITFWATANWFEREAFDLFGILFKNHPDLRRILTDYGFVGHPLRKDFPLNGEVEVRYDSQQSRVVYQPVSIDNRITTPRIIRDEKNEVAPHQNQGDDHV